jgi:hypothetical protein
MWFSNHLISGKHYLRIKKDLSDLEKAIKWCKSNDKKCKTISKNAKKMYDVIMTERYIISYFAWMMNSISTNYII